MVAARCENGVGAPAVDAVEAIEVGGGRLVGRKHRRERMVRGQIEQKEVPDL